MEVKSTVDEAAKIYKEVTGFWSNFSNFFKSKGKPATVTAPSSPKPVAKKTEKFVAVADTQIKINIFYQTTYDFYFTTISCTVKRCSIINSQYINISFTLYQSITHIYFTIISSQMKRSTIIAI